jgi:hypothetical protein
MPVGVRRYGRHDGTSRLGDGNFNTCKTDRRGHCNTHSTNHEFRKSFRIQCNVSRTPSLVCIPSNPMCTCRMSVESPTNPTYGTHCFSTFHWRPGHKAHAYLKHCTPTLQYSFAMCKKRPPIKTIQKSWGNLCLKHAIWNKCGSTCTQQHHA